MINSYISYWKRAFDFKGVSTRKEFWLGAVLPNTILEVVLFIVALLASIIGIAAFDSEILGILGWTLFYLFGFGTLIPSVAISIRRTRDIGKKWYWFFINFAPCIGAPWFIYLMCQPSVPVA